MATDDRATAMKLLGDRVRRLEAARRGKAFGLTPGVGLAIFAARHLEAKAKGGTSDSWLEAGEVFLRRAAEFFGQDRDLATIGVVDVQAWVEKLRRGIEGRKPSEGTIRHHLNAISNLYRRAQAEELVPPGFNPVAAMMEKPRATKKEARWLEVPDAALLLEAARTVVVPHNNPEAMDASIAYPLIATFLLTGGREAEILGLETADISFDRSTVTFRPNSWRRLKTLPSARVVPLWPQLEEILRAYVFRRPPSKLLFPSFRTGREAMITDWRKLLDRVAGRAGWKVGEIRSKMFRHTYCAARLQTLDGGAPVSPFTVSRELGHGSRDMVERVYSHLGVVRHRTEAVEYRTEQHQAKLAERLIALA